MKKKRHNKNSHSATSNNTNKNSCRKQSNNSNDDDKPKTSTTVRNHNKPLHHHIVQVNDHHHDHVHKNNFVTDAGCGCHIARKEEDNKNSWIIDWEDIDVYDYIDEDADLEKDDRDNYHFPDIAIDYHDKKQLWILSLCNLRTKDTIVAYITIYDTILYDCWHRPLTQGVAITNEGEDEGNSPSSNNCTTLIILCPPCTFAHLVYIDIPYTSSSPFDHIQMESDVQIWNRHHNPADIHLRTISFPLSSQSSSPLIINEVTNNDDHNLLKHDIKQSNHMAAFLCTQGIDGILTHYFVGNYHAIDFRCPVGTPICAVGNGRVVEVQDQYRHISGIATSNLYRWNSIMIQLLPDDNNNNNNDDHHHRHRMLLTPSDRSKLQEAIDGPLYIEYVHIEKSYVTVGEYISDGQIIGTTGSIGFSPEPHVHIAAYRSSDKNAPTCQVYFHKLPPPTSTTRIDESHDRNDDLAVVADSNDVATTTADGTICPKETEQQLEHQEQDNGDVLFLPVAGQWYNCYGLGNKSGIPLSKHKREPTAEETMNKTIVESVGSK